jgi:O-antigen/teichoic acid export membrane protein
MVLLRWIVRSLGFIRTIILARILVPADFGLVALAMMILGLADAVTKLRPDLALIHNTRAERLHYDTVWTLTVIRGAVMAIVLALLADVCARFFEEPRLELIIYCLAFVTFAEGFQNVGTVDFFKDLRFDRVFVLNFAGRFGSFVVAVAIALWWRNYWALIAGFATSRLLTVVLGYVMHDYRPRFALGAWREILHFSKWLLLHGIVFNLRRRADTFVIGKWLDATTLGFYDLARTVADLAGADLVSPLRSVIFPAYAKIANDRVRLRQSFIDSFAFIFSIGAPIAILTGLVADPFVKVFLGSNWIDSIPLIRILVVYALFHMCSATCGATLLALGKTRIMALGQSIGTIFAIPLIFLGMHYWAVYGVAWAVVASGALTTCIAIGFVLKELSGKVAMVLRPLWRSLGALIAMTAAVLWVGELFTQGEGVIAHSVELLVEGLVGVSVYIAGLLALWRLAGMPDGPEKHTIAAVRQSLRPKKSR